MNATVREQAETAVQAMAAKLTDEALCLAWMATEGKPVTQEVALIRGWIMDELNARLGDDLFDEWLIAINDDGNGVNPLAYLANKETDMAANEPVATFSIDAKDPHRPLV